jgi:hypothetical protein
MGRWQRRCLLVGYFTSLLWVDLHAAMVTMMMAMMVAMGRLVGRCCFLVEHTVSRWNSRLF